MWDKKTICLIDLSHKYKTMDICNKLKSNVYIFAACVIGVAVSKGDPNICGQIPKNPEYGRPELDRWRCIKDVAIKLHDQNLCLSIDKKIYDEVFTACGQGLTGNSR